MNPICQIQVVWDLDSRVKEGPGGKQLGLANEQSLLLLERPEITDLSFSVETILRLTVWHNQRVKFYLIFWTDTQKGKSWVQ